MSLSESDTRAKLIDPALHAVGWTEDHIKREESARSYNVLTGKTASGRVDYTLRVRVNAETQPVAVALIEAKAEHLPPAHGARAAIRVRSTDDGTPHIAALIAHVAQERTAHPPALALQRHAAVLAGQEDAGYRPVPDRALRDDDNLPLRSPIEWHVATATGAT